MHQLEGYTGHRRTSGNDPHPTAPSDWTHTEIDRESELALKTALKQTYRLNHTETDRMNSHWNRYTEWTHTETCTETDMHTESHWSRLKSHWNSHIQTELVLKGTQKQTELTETHTYRLNSYWKSHRLNSHWNRHTWTTLSLHKMVILF